MCEELVAQQEALPRIEICGTLLASIIDEANARDGRNSRGLLYGTHMIRHAIHLSDTQEEVSTTKHTIGILRYSFAHYPNPYKIIDDINGNETGVASSDQLLGIVHIRRDESISASFRDISLLHQLFENDASAMAKVLLIVQMPRCGGNSWTHCMHYKCLALLPGIKGITTLPVSIPSLSADSTADYTTCNTLHNNAFIALETVKLRQLLIQEAAVGIQRSVQTELLALDMLNEIKRACREAMELEQEVTLLRQSVKISQGKGPDPAVLYPTAEVAVAAAAIQSLEINSMEIREDMMPEDDPDNDHMDVIDPSPVSVSVPVPAPQRSID